MARWCVLSLPPVLQRCADLGYVVFTRGDYNLNIVGIRTADLRSNEFNDWITCTHKVNGEWVHKRWAATTDPGVYWRENPGRTAGTAILCPDQHRGCWKLGLHRGSYEALVQRARGGPNAGKVKVFRDANKDAILDMDPESIQLGRFGINIHRSSTRAGGSELVDRWSAGCQVFKEAGANGFEELINLCHKQVKAGHGETFSYTLLEDW